LNIKAALQNVGKSRGKASSLAKRPPKINHIGRDPLAPQKVLQAEPVDRTRGNQPLFPGGSPNNMERHGLGSKVKARAANRLLAIAAFKSLSILINS
jgi:hypothetical protein